MADDANNVQTWQLVKLWMLQTVLNLKCGTILSADRPKTVRLTGAQIIWSKPGRVEGQESRVIHVRTQDPLCEIRL